MNRRQFSAYVASAALLPMVSPVFAADKPWKMAIHPGLIDDKGWLLGFEITLLPHWKTYWRVPGDGGVPPAFDFKGANVKSIELLCPTPTRFRDKSGEAIGYKDNVLFLLRVAATDPSKDISGEFSAFFGVCEEVCIPAQAQGTLTSRTPVDKAGLELVQTWISRVPVTTQDLVKTATAVLVDGKPALHLDFAQVPDDVFVEGNPLHYFKAPMFDNTSAILMVAGAKSVEELHQTPLRITAKLGTGGLEQMVHVV
jgi:DsbC/DsbD-like thiol-disulfide interchange protein